MFKYAFAGRQGDWYVLFQSMDTSPADIDLDVGVLRVGGINLRLYQPRPRKEQA